MKATYKGTVLENTKAQLHIVNSDLEKFALKRVQIDTLKSELHKLSAGALRELCDLCTMLDIGISTHSQRS